jgi:hypothetical protein
MARTESPIEARTPTVLALDRETGTLVEPVNAFSTGAGAVLEKFSKTMKSNDADAVNASGEKIEKNPTDLTVIDNLTGASRRVVGDATVGLDYEHATWTQISMPKGLAACISMLGAIAPHAEAAVVEMLNTAADNGGDWEAAFEAVVGSSQTPEQKSRTDAQIKSLRREVVKTSSGRQQVSGFTVEE